MAQVEVSQELAEIGYTEPPKVEVSQLLTEIGYNEPPMLHVSQLLVEIAWTPAGRRFGPPAQCM